MQILFWNCGDPYSHRSKVADYGKKETFAYHENKQLCLWQNTIVCLGKINRRENKCQKSERNYPKLGPIEWKKGRRMKQINRDDIYPFTICSFQLAAARKCHKMANRQILLFHLCIRLCAVSLLHNSGGSSSFWLHAGLCQEKQHQPHFMRIFNEHTPKPTANRHPQKWLLGGTFRSSHLNKDRLKSQRIATMLTHMDNMPI